MKHTFILKHVRYYNVDVELTDAEAKQYIVDGKATDQLIMKCYEDADYDLFTEEFEDGLAGITDEVVTGLPEINDPSLAVINKY